MPLQKFKHIYFKPTHPPKNDVLYGNINIIWQNLGTSTKDDIDKVVMPNYMKNWNVNTPLSFEKEKNATYPLDSNLNPLSSFHYSNSFKYLHIICPLLSFQKHIFLSSSQLLLITKDHNFTYFFNSAQDKIQAIVADLFQNVKLVLWKLNEVRVPRFP